MAKRKGNLFVHVSVTVDDSEMKKHFRGMKKRSAQGFKSQFKWALSRLKKEIQQDFRTGGGGKWPPLTAKTVAWKIEEGYGNKGILIQTGALRDSLKGGSRKGAVEKVGTHNMTYGTTIKYSRWVHDGTAGYVDKDGNKVPGLPARPFMPRFGPDDAKGQRLKSRLMWAVAERIIYGPKPGDGSNRPGGYYSWLRRADGDIDMTRSGGAPGFGQNGFVWWVNVNGNDLK